MIMVITDVRDLYLALLSFTQGVSNHRRSLPWSLLHVAPMSQFESTLMSAELLSGLSDDLLG